jgi:hypothetical protein
MTENPDKWSSNSEPISIITSSVDCRENTVPSKVVRWYDLRKPGGHDDRRRSRRFNGILCGAEPGFHILRWPIKTSLGFRGCSRER